MRRHAVALLLGLGLGLGLGMAEGRAGAVEVDDDRGTHIALASPALRIVSLAPSLTEAAFAAGAGARLVGVVRFSDYPPQARTIASVGDAMRVDMERVLALKPDLVLAWKSGNQATDIERLERLGLKVYVSEVNALAGIPRLLRALGALSGTVDAAEAAAARFEQERTVLAARYASAHPRVRVFYEIWHRPLMTVNGADLISDVLRLCGGDNVFAAAPVLTPVVSLEAVAAARPQIVIGGGSAFGADALRAQWQAQPPLEALVALPVVWIDPDLIQRASPRIIAGAREICARLADVREGRDASAAR